VTTSLTRAEKVAELRRLRDEEALSVREAGARLGLSPGGAYNLLNDPDGAKQRERRKRYQGRCGNCGKTTDGSNGRTGAPEYCTTCAPAVHRTWTDEAVLRAIRDFARRYGRPPAMTDWNTALARKIGLPERAERFYRDGCWPTANSVLARFGTWNTAIRAAGFTPRRVGERIRAAA
jgi:hypothetical protein